MVNSRKPNKGPFFESVDTKVDFPQMERELLSHWYKSGIVDKYLHRNDSSKKRFSFMDGPITANNPMGAHHAWSRTFKDLWQRYKNMQGYKQRFQNGFDSQGLWVEVEVEKELGFRNKKDIENYGIAEFVQKCKDRVEKFASLQTEQSKRLGYFMDWDNSYFTMSDANNYMIWHFIKVCHENNWLYKGNESVPWCPRCETAISQHEMLTEDYKEVVHEAITFELPLEGRDREFLLVWTTTPWTLPANIAVAVDKKIEYVLVRGTTGDKYWVASDAKDRVLGNDAKVLKTVKGSELVGLKYKGPFDHLPAVAKVAKETPDKFHTIIATDERIMPITTTEGTGMVHTAVSAGTEDFRLGKKLGLPMIPVIADNADYLEGFGEFSGKNAKKNPRVILDFLEAEDKKPGNDWVFDIEKYRHRYPGCWRCKKELVWKVTKEWYIAMDKGKPTLREKMIEVAKKITWIPEFGLKRELDWLNNMQDWLISKKNRYWGLCLPIWECDKCEHFEVIGGYEDLKKKATSGWSQFKDKSPHKPFLDKVKLNCPKCKSEMTRIEPVGNPWLDAGIVSFSTITKDNKGKPLYQVDKSEWEKWFPADFITESFPGQFKNWFYSMIAMSTVLENREPYKTVLGFATVLDERGKGMHKSTGNMIEFNEGADKIGVDVMRWMYINQDPRQNLLFGFQVADEIRRQFHLILWNVYNFFITYANLDEWKPTKSKKSPTSNPLDKWILARLTETINSVTKGLDSYDQHSSAEALENFVDDLSRWYIRRSRDRVGLSVKGGKDKEGFYETTFHCLVSLSKLLAPLTPFLADVIFTNLTKEESVHLSDWPKVEKLSTEELALITQMKKVREVVELAHSARKQKQVPVRQPLASIKVTSKAEKIPAGLLTILMDETNIKDVQWKKGNKLEVKLDFKITPELKAEAEARELVREIQKERRRLGVQLTDKIIVSCGKLPDTKELLEWVKAKTLADSITEGKFKVTKVK